MSLLDDLEALVEESQVRRQRVSCDCEGCVFKRKAIDVFARIRAALADHEHLEEGARHLRLVLTNDMNDDGIYEDEFAWLAAEAKRKEQTNGED